jgi:hypothetical protein
MRSQQTQSILFAFNVAPANDTPDTLHPTGAYDPASQVWAGKSAAVARLYCFDIRRSCIRDRNSVRGPEGPPCLLLPHLTRLWAWCWNG